MIGKRCFDEASCIVQHHPDAAMQPGLRYCNEYDQVSKPVPLEEMKRRRIIWRDGTSIITISGGEPLMHPELEE